MTVDCLTGATLLINGDGANILSGTIGGQPFLVGIGQNITVPCVGVTEVIGAGSVGVLPPAVPDMSPLIALGGFFTPLMLFFIVGLIIGTSFLRGLTHEK